MTVESHRWNLSAMVTWGQLAQLRPDLTTAGRALLYQHGVGLAFLATTDRTQAPRVHPICPVLANDELFALIVPSPKRRDLARDGRYALHSYPCEDDEDAFYLTGRARPADDPALRAEVVGRFLDERASLGMTTEDLASQTLWRFAIDRCLLTRTTGHGDPSPRHTVWRAEGPAQ